jgi:hypothetical protein
MGERYTNVVLACLTGDVLGGDIEIDEVKAKMGIGYINHVVTHLEAICM